MTINILFWRFFSDKYLYVVDWLGSNISYQKISKCSFPFINFQSIIHLISWSFIWCGKLLLLMISLMLQEALRSKLWHPVYFFEDWLSFGPVFGTFAPPRIHHAPFLPNSIEKMMFSELLTRFREMKATQ